MAGLEKEIERYQVQKSDLLEIYLNRSKVGKMVTPEESKAHAAQIVDEIERLKAQMVEVQQRNGSDVPTKDQAEEAIRLLKAFRIAAKEATFAEKRTILRLLDVRVPYNGELLEKSGGVPVQAIDLDKLLKDGLTDGISSPPPRFVPSTGSPVAVEDPALFSGRRGTTICRCTRSMDSMLWFYKSSLRFSVAISLENLREPASLRRSRPARPLHAALSQ